MKAKKVRSIVAEGEKTFDDVVNELESMVVADTPVSKKDKKGGKISDMELSKMAFIKKNFSKIENFLPRDFDKDAYFGSNDELTEKNDQTADLQRLIKIINGQKTVLRIELKDGFKEIYDAAAKAAAKDASLEFIYNELKGCYGRSSKTEDEENADTEASKTK